MKQSVIAITWLILTGCTGGCASTGTVGDRSETAPFFWENANVYFLLTDRFLNGDPGNDVNFNRTERTGKLRGFEGGDLRGVTLKIEEGYFDELGVTALWLTPYFEQIHGGTDEGTGITYGYHGYWTRDWSAIDPNFGTEQELMKFVETAHEHGIRVIMDVIINHTGPVTPRDPVWPEEWVRTGPRCTYDTYEHTVTCTLVDNLPDIRTERDAAVELPPFLMQKWEEEGRLTRELDELEQFFDRTGYPRAPRYYLIKWLTDFIRKYGIDGYRLDTAKHIEEYIWEELGREAAVAFREWKAKHPDQVLDNADFFMVGEVYGYGISSGRLFSFGDREVDFYSYSINSLINFEFKESAKLDYESLFSYYSEMLHNELKGKGVMNYLSSHDDAGPFDKEREKPFEAGTKLLLAPGISQIYYGDESSRELVIAGAMGDATLRGNMNWEEIDAHAVRNGYDVGEVLQHYQKLGQFRRDHPAVGAGEHRMLSASPYTFSRQFSSGDYSDRVVVALDLEPGEKIIPVGDLFDRDDRVYDYYSGKYADVEKGTAILDSPGTVVLLGLK